MGQKLKIDAGTFFLYKFWKSFVNFVEKEGVCASTSSAPRDLFFFVVLIPKRNEISNEADSYQKCGSSVTGTGNLISEKVF